MVTGRLTLSELLFISDLSFFLSQLFGFVMKFTVLGCENKMLLLLVCLRYWWDTVCVVWVACSYVCAWTLNPPRWSTASTHITNIDKAVRVLYRLLLTCPWFLREECWNIQMLWFLFICSGLLVFLQMVWKFCSYVHIYWALWCFLMKCLF